MTAAAATTTATPLLSLFVQGKPVSVNSMYGLRGPKRPAMAARPKSQRKAPKRKYLTTEAQAWHDAVAYETMVKLGAQGRPRGEVEVHCTFRGIRGDVDNYAKLTLDGLKDGLKVDDRYFNPVVVRREPKRGRPQGALIEVWDVGRGKV